MTLGKVGRKRWMGVRPTVRGVAMNPVDHPHGGGEGRTSGGRHPVTPWQFQPKGIKHVKTSARIKILFVVVSLRNKAGGTDSGSFN